MPGRILRVTSMPSVTAMTLDRAYMKPSVGLAYRKVNGDNNQ